MAQTLAVFLYPGQTGVVNSLLQLIGLPPVIWTQSTFWMPVWIVLFSVWRGVGGVVIFFLAGLQSVDPSLYEAAHVDGANRQQTFLNITIPQIAPITLFVFVTQCVGALQMWEAPLVLTFGGPDNSTRAMVYRLYSTATLLAISPWDKPRILSVYNGASSDRNTSLLTADTVSLPNKG